MDHISDILQTFKASKGHGFVWATIKIPLFKIPMIVILAKWHLIASAGVLKPSAGILIESAGILIGHIH